MKKISIIFASLFLLVAFANRVQAQCDGGTNCYVVITGQDSYGDGWNGASITLTQNGTSLGTFTLNSGASAVDTFRVCTADGPVALTWTSGSYDSETSFTVSDSLGSILYEGSGSGLSGQFAVVGPCPTCPGVGNITVTVTSTTATATWTELGEATEWLYNLSAYDFPQGEWTTTTTNGASFDELTSNTKYYLFVRSNCGGGDTSYYVIYSFRTACGTTVLPIFESFEDNGTDIPFCWTEWEFYDYDSWGYIYHYPQIENYSYYAHSGNYVLQMTTDETHYNSIISPQIPIPANQVEVSLWLRGDDAIQVGYTTTNDSATAVFHPVATVGPSEVTNEYGYDEYIYTNFLVSFDTVATTEPIYIVFRRGPVAGYAQSLYLDDILIRESINCPVPENVREAANAVVASGQVTIDWDDAEGTVWQVAYGPQGFNLDTVTNNLVFATEHPFAITGLDNETVYDFYVRTVCGTTNGYWSGTHATVLPNVMTITESVDTVTSCGVTIVDMGGMNGSMAQNSEQLIVLLPTSEDLTVRITGQADFNGYDYYGYNKLRIFAGTDTTGMLLYSLANSSDNNINLVSEVGAMTIWAAASPEDEYGYYLPDGFQFYVSCEEKPDCTTPYNLAVDSITGVSAYISWDYSTALGEAEGFHLIITNMADGSVSSFELDGDARDFHLDGLDQRTNYRVQLALDCEGIDTISTTFATICLVGGEFEVGTGTVQSNVLPGYFYYNTSITQQIFTPADLDGNTNLYGFKFYMNNGTASDRTLAIYMDTTSMTSFASISDYVAPTAANRYFQGVVHLQMGWVEVTFDSVFVVPAGKNILVTLNDITGGYPDYSNRTCYATSTDSAMAIYGYTYNGVLDATDPNIFSNIDSWYQGVDYSRSNMVFLTPCAETSCIPPFITSNVATGDSVILTWTPGNDETAWKVEYRNADSTDWIVATEATTEVAFIVEGLESATKYQFRVSSICSDTTIGRIVTVTTPCGTEALPFSIGFEYDEPYFDGYSEITPMCWYRGSKYPYTYSYYPYTYDYWGGAHGGSSSCLSMGGYRSYIVLPKMEAPVDSLMLTFYALYADSWYDAPQFEIGVAIDPTDTSTFVVVATVTAEELDEWKEITQYFDTYNGLDGNIYIRIKGNDYTGGYIDDILVERIPSCRKITAINVENITASSITVTAVDDYNRGNYTFYWTAVGSHSLADSINVTSATATITGLDAATTYQIWARANCGGNDRSAATSPINVQTLCAPIAVTEDETYFNEFEEQSSFMCFWSTGSVNGAAWQYTSANSELPAHSGGKTISISGRAGEAMVVLPTFDFTGMTGDAELSFYYYMCTHDNWGYSLGSPDPIAVYYRAGESGAWTLLSNIDTNTTDTWVKRYFMLPNSQGAPVYQVAIKGISTGNSAGTAVDDIRVKGETTCLPPSNITVSDVTERTALVSWTGSAASYKVQYRPRGQWSWNARIVSGDNSVTISPLEMASIYEVRIIALCSTYEQSDPSDVLTFLTDFCDDRNEAVNYSASATAATTSSLADISKYYNYTEVMVPATTLAGMGNINGLGFKVDTLYTPFSGHLQIFAGFTTASNMTAFHYDTSYTVVYDENYTMNQGWNSLLFSTPIEWDGASNLVLGFYVNNNDYYSDSIRYGAHIAASNLVYTGFSSSYFMPEYANLLSAGSRSASNVVPDLKLIGCNATCYEPVIYRVTTTDNSVTVEWYNEGADVQVSIRSTAVTDWDDPVDVTGTNSYTFTNMPSMTDFEVRVRRNCSGVEEVYSDWVYDVARTDTSCSIPTNLVVSNISASNATFNWSDGAVVGTRWELHVWSEDIDNYYDVTSKPFTVTDLVRGGNYHAEVRAYCASGNHVVGDFCEAIDFDNVCYPPTNLTATRNASGDVVLNWTPGERNTQWVVAYGYRGFFLNEQLGFQVVNTPTATISGLSDVSEPSSRKSAEGTTYGFRVRAICADEWNSDWNSEEVLVHISTVGINDVNDAASFTLQPNPATSNVTVVLGEMDGDATVSILSIDGRRMTQFTTSESRVKIDLTDYASGAYFVQVQSAQGISVRKLVVR